MLIISAIFRLLFSTYNSIRTPDLIIVFFGPENLVPRASSEKFGYLESPFQGQFNVRPSDPQFLNIYCFAYKYKQFALMTFRRSDEGLKLTGKTVMC
jgi:hypothetical protein